MSSLVCTVCFLKGQKALNLILTSVEEIFLPATSCFELGSFNQFNLLPIKGFLIGGGGSVSNPLADYYSQALQQDNMWARRLGSAPCAFCFFVAPCFWPSCSGVGFFTGCSLFSVVSPSESPLSPCSGYILLWHFSCSAVYPLASSCAGMVLCFSPPPSITLSLGIYCPF